MSMSNNDVEVKHMALEARIAADQWARNRRRKAESLRKAIAAYAMAREDDPVTFAADLIAMTLEALPPVAGDREAEARLNTHSALMAARRHVDWVYKLGEPHPALMPWDRQVQVEADDDED